MTLDLLGDKSTVGVGVVVGWWDGWLVGVGVGVGGSLCDEKFSINGR